MRSSRPWAPSAPPPLGRRKGAAVSKGSLSCFKHSAMGGHPADARWCLLQAVAMLLCRGTYAQPGGAGYVPSERRNATTMREDMRVTQRSHVRCLPSHDDCPVRGRGFFRSHVLPRARVFGIPEGMIIVAYGCGPRATQWSSPDPSGGRAGLRDGCPGAAA